MKRWETNGRGQWRPKRREDRKPVMSGDYSDGEGSVGPDAEFVDVTVETEVELRLPMEVDMKPDQPREDVPTFPGDVDPDVVDLGQDVQCRFEPPSGARPKWPGHRLPLPRILEPRRPLSGATVQLAGSGDGRRKQGAANPTYTGLAQR